MRNVTRSLSILLGLFLLFFTQLSYSQNTWQPAGPDDQLSFNYRSIGSELVFNNSIPYVATISSGDNKVSVKRFINGKWEFVGNPEFSADYVVAFKLAFVGNTPYVAYKISNTITVVKLNAGGTMWEAVGTGLSSNSDQISLVANNSGLYIAYSDLIRNPVLQKLNDSGTDWMRVSDAEISDTNKSSYVTLSFDGNTPIVAYWDGKINVKKLNVDGTVWETVSAADFSGFSTGSLVLALNGATLYIAHTDNVSSSKLTVKRLNAGGTSVEIVGEPGLSSGTATYITMAFNGSTPYIGYSNNDSDMRATVIKLNTAGTAWETVGNENFSDNEAGYNSIAVEGGVPYLVSTGNLNTHVRKLNSTSQLWEVVGGEGISSGGQTGSSPIFSLEYGNGSPYLAYRDMDYGGKLTVKKLVGSNWELVGPPGFSSTAVDDITLAFNGPTLYVAFRGNGARVMKLNNGSNSWEAVGGDLIGTYPHLMATNKSLAFAGSVPYLLFKELIGHSIVASVVKLNNEGTAWETVGTPQFPSSDASVLVIKDSIPYIAMDQINKGKVIRLNDAGTDWEQVGPLIPSVIEMQMNVIGDDLYVAYGRITKANVKKLSADGTAWEVVGAPDFSVGSASYVALTSMGGKPYVAFRDDSGPEQKATVMKLMDDGTGWEAAGVQGLPDGHTSHLTITSNGTDKLYLGYLKGSHFVRQLIDPQAPDNAELSNLTLSHGSLATPFNYGTLSYTASVAASVSSIALTPYTTTLVSTVKVNGMTVATGTSSDSIPLEVGENTINIEVTGGDGTTTKTYVLTITRPTISSNANLATLLASGIDLSPAFATSISQYTASVPNETVNITFTSVAEDPAATIKINGATIASGTSSAPISLNLGSNTVNIVVTAEDNSTTKTYTITVTRLPSTDASLAFIAGPVALSPAFQSDMSDYTMHVTTETSMVQFTTTVGFAGATVTVNGTSVVSGTASEAISVPFGESTVTFECTAADGITTRTYKVVIARPLSDNANLVSLIPVYGYPLQTPAFHPDTLKYTTFVENSVATHEINIFKVDSNATVKVNGVLVKGNRSSPGPLNVGVNIINIEVTAQDGITKKAYVLTMTRGPSKLATLSALSVPGLTLSPSFDSGQMNYSATVSDSVTTISIVPTQTEETATIQVNGLTVPSDTESELIPLNTGINTINVLVTAGDSVTTLRYTVTIVRLSSDAGLKVVQFGGTVLSPAFTPETETYTSSAISYDRNTVSILLIRNFSGAVAKINGVTVTDFVPTEIPLVVGPNKITIEVTAEDGVTTKIYTISVTRQPMVISNVATLSVLSFSEGVSGELIRPAFAPDPTDYTVTVSRMTTSINMALTVTNPGAEVKVNGEILDQRQKFEISVTDDAPKVYTITVTSTDSTKTKNYKVTVKRDVPSADLIAISITSSNLMPKFDPAVTSYSLVLPNSNADVIVRAIPFENTATHKVNGNVVERGWSTSLPLAVGINEVSIEVATDTGLKKTYTINVTRLPLPVAELSAFRISSGRIYPGFSAITYDYTAAVPNDSISVSIIPTVFTAGATVRVNGVSVQSGTTSGKIGLAVGANIIQTVVTSADGNASKTYTLKIVRASKDGAVPDASGRVTLSPTSSKVVVSSPTQAVRVSVPPGMTNPSVDYSSLISSGSGTIPETSITSDVAIVNIPASTKVTASDPGWDGIIGAPVITTYDLPPVYGEILTTGLVIEVGSPNISLSFDKAVRLVLPGQAGTRAAFVHSGIYKEITTIGTSDSQLAGDELPADDAFKMDVGPDLVIWTKAFSRFITFTQTTDINVAIVASDMGSLIADMIKGINADLDHITGTLADPLPTGLPGGSSVSWASSDVSLVSSDGQTINRPLLGSTPPLVTLTATVTKGFITEKKAFALTLTPLPNQAPTLNAIANQTICFTPTAQTIALTGIGAGPESGQTTSLSVSSSNSELLSGLAVNSTTGIISYTTANAAGGVTTITVTIKDNGGTADEGIDSLVRTFTITANPSPDVQIFNSMSTHEVSKGLSLTLTATGGSSYSWADAAGIISGQNSATLTVRPAVSTTYTVAVTNTSGCISTRSIYINVVEDYKTLDINNIMSPNGDGVNDALVIKNLDMYPNHIVKIFDRAGRMLYQKQNYTNDWNGTFQGAPLTEGTYFYVVDFGDGKKVLKGFVSIVN